MSKQVSAVGIKKALDDLGDDDSWISKHKFQKDVVDNAFYILNRRLVGHMMHHSAWVDDNAEADVVAGAFYKFDHQQLDPYRRWKSLTKVSGGYDEKEKDSKDGVIDIPFRMRRLFLYYLVYGEIHDFRGLKSTLHLFFHAALDMLKNNQDKIADWLRTQGHRLYRLLMLVYSKDEMNGACFHHDDLDDLCTSSKFILKHFWNQEGTQKDFLVAFNVDKPDDAKFPALSKMVNLDTFKFLKFWAKGEQGSNSEDDRQTREKWILENLAHTDAAMEDTVKELQTELQKLVQSTKVSEEGMNRSNAKMDSMADRWKPSEEDYDDRPDVLSTFRLANTQFETAKELILSAEASEKDGYKLLGQAKVEHFRNREESEAAYTKAQSLLMQSEHDFEEGRKGFERAAEGFSSVQDCKTFLAEALYLKEKSSFKRVSIEADLVRSRISKILQFFYEDTINKERAHFAKAWKTYFERAGGKWGWRGYATICFHYRDVIYLHLFLLLPIVWLYFDYHLLIDLDDFIASMTELTDVETLMDPESNIILLVGSVVAMMIVAFIILNTCLRASVRGYSAPRRDKGISSHFDFSARFATFILWMLTIVTEIVVMKVLVLNPIKEATEDFTLDWDWVKSPALLIVHWLPTLILYFSSLQFLHTLWIGVFGWIYGLKDGAYNCRTWGQLVASFDRSHNFKKDDTIHLPQIVPYFWKSMMPATMKEESDMRKYIAFAKVWNSIINYFYEIHKIGKEELQRYSYKIKQSDPKDFLSGTIDKEPELAREPSVKEVSDHLVRFINNVKMKKPHKRISVKEMLPLTVVTPVGNEKILYPYEFITHADNTQSSFLQHVIDASPVEWQNFKSKECLTEKAKDWVDRMEKDILQGVQPDQLKKGKKRWIHDTTEGQITKRKVCEWASLRFQALFRTLNGFMQAPRALEVLARIQNPTMSQVDAEALVRLKFSYLVGYQSYASSEALYKKTKTKAKDGEDLTKSELEAHDVVFNIKYIKSRFPELKIAYPCKEKGKFIGKMGTGLSKSSASSNYYDYSIEMFGPFGDMGLGKPTHQNFLAQFIDGLIIQTIDINQDSVLSQSFFVPNVLAEFDKDTRIKIVGCPEFVITTNWSSTAWCSAFSEKTFGTLVQRCYARLGIRLHYGHPDYLDGLFVMTETGLSKLPYVSEDIFTGFDTIIKGGRITHIEYHEVGKARDVDLYTTTKFQRKISMGASQMACSRYINQMQSCSSVSYWQGLSFYYSTVGFYINHMILYLSVWFALVSQLILIIVQQFILGDEIANFITTRIFTIQVGFALVAPGIMQLWLEKGVLRGTWNFLSHFLILAVYSTFHILNIASFWQWGLVKSAFYLASGRGTGLEHYFMKDMYDNFYKTHWRSGFMIFWMGVLALVLSGSIFVFLIMYLLPAGIWLWGAMFLNPGSLPSTVHEEQWKRLINRDMKETAEIIKNHVPMDRHSPLPHMAVKRFFVRIYRGFRQFFRLLHFIYTAVNFTIHMRALRVIAIFTLGWEYVLAEKIPTFIFTDERRRVLRWDEEESRQKSIFFSSIAHKDKEPPKPPKGSAMGSVLKASGMGSALKKPFRRTESHIRVAMPQDEATGAARPLPAPPPKKGLGERGRKRSVRFLTVSNRASVNMSQPQGSGDSKEE